MTLTTHAVIGAAAASMVPGHPTLAFGLAFASHFVLDAIPHWHYPVKSMKKDKRDRMNNDMVIGRYFVSDMAVIGSDALLGIGISLIVFSYFGHLSWQLILIGTIAGILPDPLQFVYWKFRHEPFIYLQRLHMGIHATTDLDDRLLLGVGSQILLILGAVLAIMLIV
ncbi:MAG: hypothetical protein HY007_01870 [Candidatus Sungbacteria bacterium]|nr:hypothetical protein [Candidatus Sungbacteria bacterium]